MSLAELNAISRAFARHAKAFDLDVDHLGEELLDIAAYAILNQMDRELDYDGNPWPALQFGYFRWKAEGGGISTSMAVLYGKMKTIENLRGERDITPTRAASTFGTAGEPDARQEAEWFQEGFDGTDSLGRVRYQPPRRFYGFTAAAKLAAHIKLSQHFRTVI